VSAGNTLQNVRDVGRIPVITGGHIGSGILYRGDAPHHGDDVPALAPWPPRTVIDLRSSEERPPAHPLAGPRTDVASIPLAADASITHMIEAPDELPDDLATLYVKLLRTATVPLVRAVALFLDRPAPILVHCTAGKDRTGLVIAVVLSAVGVARAHVVADYIRTAPNMPGVLDRIAGPQGMESGLDMVRSLATRRPELLEAPRVAIDAALDELAAGGGAATWLLERGMAAGQLSDLRERLVTADAPTSPPDRD
jgi:protein-tyrosine phosphatase